MFRAENNKLQAVIDFFRDAETRQLQKNPVYFHEHPFVYEQQKVEALFDNPAFVRVQPNKARGILINGKLILAPTQKSATLFRNVFLISIINAIGQSPHLLDPQAGEELAAFNRGLRPEERAKAVETLENLRLNNTVVDFPNWQVEKLANFRVFVHPTILQNIHLDKQGCLAMQAVIRGAADIFEEIDRLCHHFERLGSLDAEKIKLFKEQLFYVFRDVTRDRGKYILKIKYIYEKCQINHQNVFDLFYFEPKELVGLGYFQAKIPYHIEYYQPEDLLASVWRQDLRRYGPRKEPEMSIDESMDHFIAVFEASYVFARDNDLFVEWINREKIRDLGYCLDGKTKALETQMGLFREYILERRQKQNRKPAWTSMYDAMETIINEYFLETKNRLVLEDRPTRIDQLPKGLDATYPIMSFAVRNYKSHHLQDGSVITKESVIRYLWEQGYDLYNEETEKQAAVAAYAKQRFKAHYFERTPIEERYEAVERAIAGVDGLNIDSPEEKAEYLRLLEAEKQQLAGGAYMTKEQLTDGVEFFRDSSTFMQSEDPVYFLDHPYVYEKDSMQRLFRVGEINVAGLAALEAIFADQRDYRRLIIEITAGDERANALKHVLNGSRRFSFIPENIDSMLVMNQDQINALVLQAFPGDDLNMFEGMRNEYTEAGINHLEACKLSFLMSAAHEVVAYLRETPAIQRGVTCAASPVTRELVFQADMASATLFRNMFSITAMKTIRANPNLLDADLKAELEELHQRLTPEAIA